MYKASEMQINQWKVLHGEVFECVVGDKILVEKKINDQTIKELVWEENAKRCYLRKPTRAELSYSMTLGHNPLKSDEVLLQGCWIDGDMEIQTNDEYFLAARLYMGNLVNKKEAELKKC